MTLFKNEEEYYRLAGDYFRSESKDTVHRAFAWERDHIRKNLDQKNYVKADFYLASLSAKLKYEKSNFYNNPDLYDYAREWVLENFDLVKEVAFAADQQAARRDSGYLFVKFAKEKDDFGILAEVAIFIYHTLRFYERYLFQANKATGEKKRNEYVIRVALIGAYRYGFMSLVKPLLNDETLREIVRDIPDENKTLYHEIKELIGREGDSVEYISFIALSDFSLPFRERIAESLEGIKKGISSRIENTIGDEEDRNIITSEITTYLERLVQYPA